MGLVEFMIMFVLGLVVLSLLFRWLMQKYVRHDADRLDHMEAYQRRMGDEQGQQINERRKGSAAKNKVHHDFEGARIQASPTPMHIPETSRLALDEDADTSDPVPLSDLLPDDKQRNKR